MFTDIMSVDKVGMRLRAKITEGFRVENGKLYTTIKHPLTNAHYRLEISNLADLNALSEIDVGAEIEIDIEVKTTYAGSVG